MKVVYPQPDIENSLNSSTYLSGQLYNGNNIESTTKTAAMAHQMDGLWWSFLSFRGSNSSRIVPLIHDLLLLIYSQPLNVHYLLPITSITFLPQLMALHVTTLISVLLLNKSNLAMTFLSFYAIISTIGMNSITRHYAKTIYNL